MPRILSALAAVLFAIVMTPAQAVPVTYTIDLSGAAESPPNASPGTGTGTVVLDLDAHTMSLDVVFSGLVGNLTVAHIHCCTATPGIGTAGVATTVPTFPGFPAGVTAGAYSHIFDLTEASSWNPAFITANGGTLAGAETFFAAGVDAGRAYLNLHSSVFPGGEIRGFLQLQVVPEPASLGLMMLALAAAAATTRRRPRG